MHITQGTTSRVLASEEQWLCCPCNVCNGSGKSRSRVRVQKFLHRKLRREQSKNLRKEIAEL